MSRYRVAFLVMAGLSCCASAVVGCGGEEEVVADSALPGQKEEQRQDGQRHFLQRGDTGPKVRDLYRYLRAYGYFPNPALNEYEGWKPVIDREPAHPEVFDELIEEALALFQRAHGLTADGTLNEETAAVIAQPRCGFPDYYHRASRAGHGGETSGFVQSGSKWSKSNLTFSYMNFTADLPTANIQAAQRGALDRWASVTGLRFTQTATNGDIQIGFYEGNHGDGYPFDGPFDGVHSTTLAHAFYPGDGGDAHFDDAETWTEDGTGFDLATVSLHEFGHSIGLNHSADSTAVMYAYYSGTRRNLALDDIFGAQSLYGLKSFAWSSDGPIPGRYCTQINEEADPHTWTDNYLCSVSDYGIRWSNDGPIVGMRCTQIYEDAEPPEHTWNDNYLCVPMYSTLYFTWSQDGPIAGKTCTQWYEAADPHTWMDNYLCY